MRKSITSLFIFSLLAISTPFSFPAQAQEIADDNLLPNYSFEASVGEAGLSKDLSLNAFEGKINIGIPAGQLVAPTTVALTAINESVAGPAGLRLTGSLYQIDIPATAMKSGRYFVSIASSGSDAYKEIYFFDKNYQGGTWRPLPTNENFGKGVISTYVTLPFARLAVFENPKVLVKGAASWYRYKNGLFAASPDFPAGTRLRVINLDNKKSVDVVVNDHGPDRSKHPERVVDLDAVAFARLAPLGQGTMRVAVEKLPSEAVINAPSAVTPAAPKGEMVISSKAALVFNSADKKVLWSNHADAQLPLASLTKLVAVKVFLDTKPDLNKVVAYSIKDEELNNQYVKPNESARLRLADGDQLRIKDFVYSSLVGSTNNTVETLVRVSGLTRANFIKKMNETVVKWGATKTKFVEPTGLSPKNVTTANDYAIIAREAFLNPLIAEASTLPSYSLTTINTKRPHSFKNTNLLARTDASLLGSKTGYLTEAGYCLVTKWPTEKDKNVIVVVLGAPTRQASVDDTKTLMNYAAKHIN